MTVVLWVLAGVLAFFAIILWLPLRVRLRWREDLRIWAGLGPVMITVFPAKPAKKEKKPAKTPSKVKSPSSKKTASKPAFRLAKITPAFALELAKIGKWALGRLFSSLKIRRLKLHAVSANSDPGKAAMAYGSMAAGVYTLASILERNINWRKTEVLVEVDFDGESWFSVDAEIGATPLVLVIAGVRGYFRFAAANANALGLEEKEEEASAQIAG